MNAQEIRNRYGYISFAERVRNGHKARAWQMGWLKELGLLTVKQSWYKTGVKNDTPRNNS